MVEERSLPVIQAGGFSVYVDAFAWEPDPASETPRMWLWFLSLLGPQQALKAIWARLVKGELVTFSREALGQVHFCTLAPQGPKSWRSYSAKLPTAAGHQLVLLPEIARHGAARDDFLILPPSNDDAPLQHFRFLDRRVDLPLHPSWSHWLWERALRTGEAVALQSEGSRAYRCTPNPAELAIELSAAVRDGLLGIPDPTVEERDGTSR